MKATRRIRLLSATAVVVVGSLWTSNTTAVAESTNPTADTASSVFSTQSTSSVTPTPVSQIENVFLSGSTVIGRTLIDDEGRTVVQNATHIMASNGFTYTVIGLHGNYYAVDDRNGAIFDTKGDPYGDTAKWNMASMLTVIYIVKWFMDFLAWLGKILLGVFILTIVFVIWLDWRRFGGGRRGMEPWETQWHNDDGVVYYDYLPYFDEAGFRHPGLLPDARWLTGQDPTLNAHMRANPDISRWLDTGVTPVDLAGR